MRHVLAHLVILCAALSAGCDSGPDPSANPNPNPDAGHEAVADEMIGTMREMVQVVKGVTNEQSAKEARPKLQALRKRSDEQKARADKLGSASAETERRLQARHGKEMEQLSNELTVELMRIAQDPKIAPHMREAMQGL